MKRFILILGCLLGALLISATSGAQSDEELVSLARKYAKQVTDADYHDVLIPTLTHCADVLDRQWFPGSVSYARKKRIRETLQSLTASLQQNTWNFDGFRGMHQWARVSEADQTVQPYALYVPDTYDAGRQYGLIITLSGIGGDEYRIANDLAQAQPDDFLLVSPFSRGNAAACEDIWIDDVFALMQHVQTWFSIDPDRIYATGMSLGGKRSWCLGQSFPDTFAAIAVFSGWTDTERLENMHALPVLVVHGTSDSGGCAIEEVRHVVDILKSWNAPVRYEELPGVGHNAWSEWMREKGPEAFFDYFRNYRRHP